MYIPSVLFSFLEAALKRQARVIKAEIKQLMSAQLKTHLAMHGGGQTMVKKMTVWETHFQLWLHSNESVVLQRITFLGVKFDLRFLRILKTTSYLHFWGIIFLIFLSLFRFQANVPFLYQSIEVKKVNIGQK